MLDSILHSLSSHLPQAGVIFICGVLGVLAVFLAGMVVTIVIDGIFDTSSALVWFELWESAVWTPVGITVLVCILLRRILRGVHVTEFSSILFDPAEYWEKLFSRIGISSKCSDLHTYETQNFFGAREEHIDGDVTYTINW